MVSRKHAQITIEEDQVTIEDLGSTNGTFVNGERISTSSIKLGDRVLIGTSIMKLVEADKDMKETRVSEPAIKPQEDTNVKKMTGYGVSSMSGTIGEVPLPDLIQLFGSSKKSGTLVVTVGGVEGKLHLDKGKIIYASVSNAKGLKPIKAVFRILSWQDGTFELLGPEPHNFPEQIDMSTEHILMEGLRQIDEIRHMQRKLPPPETELLIATPLLPKLSDLSPSELEVFQLVYNYGSVGNVLDRASATDLDVAYLLGDLIEKGYVTEN
jgi:hypothetical protein